jgi:hypothetical protein
MARQLARRHQRGRIAGIVVVCLGLAVLAIAVIALREPNGHVSGNPSNVANRTTSNLPSTTPGGPNRSASGSASPAADDLRAVPLIVLNNSIVSGLAEQATHDFEQGGWTVTRYGNLQNTIISTCAYFDPSAPNARAAARQLQQQFPSIDRVRPKFPQLPSGPIVVVLTGDYTST